MSLAAVGVNGQRRVAVCSWSLQPHDARELVERTLAAGADAVQLALEPIRDGTMFLGEVRTALADAGIAVVSGMAAFPGEDYSTLESIRATGGLAPDDAWEANLAAATEHARIARLLEIHLVTLHAGFVPHDPADPRRAVLLDRIRQVANRFAAAGVRLGLETGQESAETMAALLGDLGRARVGVNFDPANMILYGMGEPVTALDRLRDRVVQIHLKDALPSAVRGQWGTEVPLGDGAVDWEAFFAIARQLPVDLVIEREAGAERVADIRRAREFTGRLLA